MPVTNYLNWVIVAYSEYSLMNSLKSITSSRTLMYSSTLVACFHFSHMTHFRNEIIFSVIQNRFVINTSLITKILNSNVIFH